MKTKLFIDFDNTLFDTRPLKKIILESFDSAGFSRDEISTSYKNVCKIYDNNYSPERHADFLLKTRSFDKKPVLNKINNFVKKSSKYLFSDSIDFLAGLDRKKFEIMLLSYGNREFQSNKVKWSGVEKYFDLLYFCQEEKWIFLKGLVEIEEKFIIIDDRGDALNEISKEFKNSLTIQINRTNEPMDIAEKPSLYSGVTIKELFSAEKYLT